MKNIIIGLISMLYAIPLYYLIEYKEMYLSIVYIIWLLMTLSGPVRKVLKMDV